MNLYEKSTSRIIQEELNNKCNHDSCYTGFVYQAVTQTGIWRAYHPLASFSEKQPIRMISAKWMGFPYDSGNGQIKSFRQYNIYSLFSAPLQENGHFMLSTFKVQNVKGGLRLINYTSVRKFNIVLILFGQGYKYNVPIHRTRDIHYNGKQNLR